VGAVSDGFSLWEQPIPKEAIRLGRLTLKVQATRWVDIRVVDEDGIALRNMPLIVWVPGQSPPPSGPVVTEASGNARIPLPKVSQEGGRNGAVIVRIQGSGEYGGTEVDAGALDNGATVTLSRTAKRNARFLIPATADLAEGAAVFYSVVEQPGRLGQFWRIARVGVEVEVTVKRDGTYNLVVSSPNRMAFSVPLLTSSALLMVSPPGGRTIRVSNLGPRPEVVGLGQIKPSGSHWRSPFLQAGDVASVWIQSDAMYVAQVGDAFTRDPNRRIDFWGKNVTEVSVANGRIAIR
jgi:hypothetical protein